MMCLASLAKVENAAGWQEGGLGRYERHALGMDGVDMVEDVVGKKGMKKAKRSVVVASCVESERGCCQMRAAMTAVIPTTMTV